MSSNQDIFTVVLDLSRVKNDEKSNQLYLAMADTTKMKMIYEFKLYIQFLFSLDCSVELFHEDVRLPDLEDIRVLSRLDVVQVRPSENVKNKYEGKKLIPKSKEYNEKHGDGGPSPMPGDNVANCNYIDSKENVCNFKSLEAGKIVQAQEVSGFCAYEKAEMSFDPSFSSGDRACSTVQKPKDYMMRNVRDMQENKTFRLGEKTGIAENLKLGALLQSRYYGLCGKPDGNIVTGRSRFEKSYETPDLKSGKKHFLLKSSGKFTDADGGMENKLCIPNEGDVNISKNTFKGTIWSPVKLKETNNHDLFDKKPPACEIRSKSCSRSRPDPHSGPFGSNVIPGTVQKPLTSVTANSCEKKPSPEANFGRKPLTVDEALKLLTEAAAERSKTLSGNNPASHNDQKKNQFKGMCKTFKANPAGGSQNFQKGNVKHQITSKGPGTAAVIPDGHIIKAVSGQFLVSKQEMKKSKVNKKAGSGDKNQGNALLKGCEKPCENQSQNTGSTGKFEAKTGTQNEKMCKVDMATETGDKSQGKASVKGCEKIDGNQGRKTESTGKDEAKTGAPNPVLQCEATQKKKRSKKKMKARLDMKSVSHPMINDCEHFDNSHVNDKIGVAGKTESETAPRNHFVKYGNVKNKKGPGDDFGELSNSESAFLYECLHFPAPKEIIKGKAINGGESAEFEKSPSRKLNSSRGDSEPGVGLQSLSPDNPTGVDTSSENTSGKDARTNSRTDLQMIGPLNTEDEDGANVSNSSADSSRNLHISGAAVAYPFLDLQGKTIGRDDNKDKSQPHGSPVTNKVITLPSIITDNTSVGNTNCVNTSGDGGEGGLVSSQGQVDLTRNHSREGFRTGDAAALTGVGAESTRVGRTDSDSSGSRAVPKDESIALSLRIAESVKIEESQGLHGPEGPGRDTKFGQLPSSRAASPGQSANVGTGFVSKSSEGKKKPAPSLKECVIC